MQLLIPDVVVLVVTPPIRAANNGNPVDVTAAKAVLLAAFLSLFTISAVMALPVASAKVAGDNRLQFSWGVKTQTQKSAQNFTFTPVQFFKPNPGGIWTNLPPSRFASSSYHGI